MENLAVLSCLIFTILTLFVLFYCAFSKVYKENKYLSEYGQNESQTKGNSEDTVHSHHLLGLALEAADYRAMEEATTDQEQKQRYHQFYSNVSTEVVDTVLALNGLDPHPGVILGAEDEEDETVVQFSDYKAPKAD